MKSTYKNLSLLGIALPPIGSRAMPSKDGLTHFSEHSLFILNSNLYLLTSNFQRPTSNL